jgi:hypothetical protein
MTPALINLVIPEDGAKRWHEEMNAKFRKKIRKIRPLGAPKIMAGHPGGLKLGCGWVGMALARGTHVEPAKGRGWLACPAHQRAALSQGGAVGDGRQDVRITRSYRCENSAL